MMMTVGVDRKNVPKVAFISLGCPKALVDSERILTRLRAEGYELTPGLQKADVVVVNTCGFLDSARAESFSTIDRALKENGKVIVTGCLGAEPDLIESRFTTLLSITGPQAYEQVVAAVKEAVPPPQQAFGNLVPPQEVRLTPRHYAYVKIAEGCNNRCSFCIIPRLRGRLVSRSFSEVMREAERLVRVGVKELLIVSQDTAAYGLDLRYAKDQWAEREVETRVFDLARELGSLGIWVRLHYIYPYPHVERLIQLMAEGRILPYLDMPLQHASPSVLKAMRRPGDQEKTLHHLEEWRKICPDLTIRSTMMVGFPGEREEDFEFLLEWMSAARLDRLGAFKYEGVAGAEAHHLGLAPVPEEEKDKRYARLMAHQQSISRQRMAEKIGQNIKVLVDHVSATGGTGRSKGDAPEIDGQVSFVSRRPVRVGDIISVKITGSDIYDISGVAAI